jgi:hypothetical protein
MVPASFFIYWPKEWKPNQQSIVHNRSRVAATIFVVKNIKDTVELQRSEIYSSNLDID